MKLVYDITRAELDSLMFEWGEPVYRARQIWQGLYRQYWDSPEKFTNIPITLRTRLAETLEFNVLTLVTSLSSSDGQTVKSLFKLPDGRSIEAVLMKYNYRNTLCVSSQAGCAMGCVFCATGQMGFKRHLLSGEIVAQVMYYARLLNGENNIVNNIVLMGMGEPFHNYDNTLDAIDRLNDPEGYGLGARHFTISTVGLIPIIRLSLIHI